MLSHGDQVFPVQLLAYRPHGTAPRSSTQNTV